MTAMQLRSCRVGMLTVLGGVLAASAAIAQESALVGDWHLTLNERRAVHTGTLTIESKDGRLEAFVDGGPAPRSSMSTARSSSSSTRATVADSFSVTHSRGRVDGDKLGGVLTPPLDAPQGTWRAARHVVPPPAAAKPVDFTGVWSRTSSGLARVTLDYTPAAQSAVDAYHYLDDPALRCVSPGLVRISGWPYPLEVVQNDTQVTILYESFHEVRRIFLDGRQLPEDLPHRALGYSLGHWEGSTLSSRPDVDAGLRRSCGPAALGRLAGRRADVTAAMTAKCCAASSRSMTQRTTRDPSRVTVRGAASRT